MALTCPKVDCRSDECQHEAGDIAFCRSCGSHFFVATRMIVDPNTLVGTSEEDGS